MIIMPPPAVWSQIQEIRRKFDKSFNRWMPHINLLYPFFPSDQFPDLVSQLRNATSQMEPFSITFSEFRFFKHNKSCTLWLNPVPENPVKQLQQLLEQTFPICNDLSQRSEEGVGFTPHCSVGQFPTSAIVKNQSAFQSQWKPIQFTVNEVYVIARENFDSPFRIHYRVPLGKSQSLSPECLLNVVPPYDSAAVNKSLGIHRFDSQQKIWRKLDESLDNLSSRSVHLNIPKLRIVSWNILFDIHDTDTLFPNERVPLISNVLKKSCADVIVLQEVTTTLLTKLTDELSKWANDYYVVDLEGSALQPYGVFVMTKFHPVVCSEHTYSSGRNQKNLFLLRISRI